MPRTKSAKKQMRRSKGATARNRSQRSTLRTALKRLREAGAGGAETATAYREAEKQLDRSARKGLIHPNTAARQKSRLARRVKQ